MEENSQINKFIENEDWEAIYNKLMETKKMNIMQGELPSKRIFIREHNENYPPPSLGGLSLEFLSYRSMDDTTMTVNLIKTRLKMDIPGYKVDTLAIDTSYHFWKFYFNKWYLLDFERREMEDN
ncbi:MAG TPA: hypothetical protein VMT35_11690 [Ignavibacteriaceae bacterium]|nr:hypothetical protein [Ignavibacteriaceae bacterium]